MFANYDYSNFPIVKVDLSGIIIDNEDFTNFTQQWINLYENKIPFTFIFDTKKCGLVNPLYCIYTAFFIKSLKKRNIQYLQKSIIYVYNIYVFKLTKIIFYIEKPVAPVELIFINEYNEQKIEYINN